MDKEQKKAPTPEFSFNIDAEELAAQLEGATFQVGDIAATVVTTEWYSKDENTRGAYKQLLHQLPGRIVGVPHHNEALAVVTAREGSCVLLRAVECVRPEATAELIVGPGNIGRTLGLEKNGVLDIAVQDPQAKVFSLNPTLIKQG
jgi:3-methyladenine DNA glycosylase Mpg